MKRLNFLLISSAIALTVSAQPRSVQDALREASSFVSASTYSVRQAQPDADIRLCYTVQQPGLAEAAAFMFQVGEDDGFVLVSAEEKAGTILGYSDEGHFDADDIPENMQIWLQHYAEEIAWAKTHSVSGHSASGRNATTLTSSRIEPLLGKIAWNQGAPFWDNCPKDSNGRSCYSGCVATATAQIMRYWKTPTKGKGSHSYSWTKSNGSRQTLSADFSSSTYNWNNMIPNYNYGYTSPQGQAVAKLMYDVGVATDMQYSSSGSGTFTELAAQALYTYFGYDASMRAVRPEYAGDIEFAEQMLYELESGRPVLMSGATTHQEGHAFVCDGYDGNGCFHINWGWGGSQNGFFALTALDPAEQGMGGAASGEGFSVGVLGVMGIMPDQGGTKTLPAIGTLSLELLSDSVTTLDKNISLRINELQNTGLEGWKGGYFGFAVLDADRKLLSWVDKDYFDGGIEVYEYYPGYINCSGKLSDISSDGKYTLTPVFTNENGSKFWPVDVGYGSLKELPFIVEGNTVKFILTPETDYSIRHFKASAAGSTVNLSFESEAPYFHVKVFNDQCTYSSDTISFHSLVVSNVPDGEWTAWVRPLDETKENYIGNADSANVIIDTREIITLKLLANDGEMGSVSGNGTYYSGDTARIEAVANEYFEFVKWSDGDSNASRTMVFEKTGTSPRTITLTAEFGYIEANQIRDLQASLRNDSADISFESEASLFHIKVYNSQGTTLLDGIIDSNELTVCDIPEGEWTIWVRSLSESGEKYIGDADSTVIIVDLRDIITLQLLSNDDTMGSVTGGGEYHSGDDVEIEAIVRECFEFVKWSDGDTNPARTLHFEKTGETPRTVTLTAEFSYIEKYGISNLKASVVDSLIYFSFDSEAPVFHVKVYNSQSTILDGIIDSDELTVYDVPEGEWTIWVRPAVESMEYYIADAATANVTVYPVIDGIADVRTDGQNVRKYLKGGRIVIETPHHLYDFSGRIAK